MIEVPAKKVDNWSMPTMPGMFSFVSDSQDRLPWHIAMILGAIGNESVPKINK